LTIVNLLGKSKILYQIIKYFDLFDFPVKYDELVQLLNMKPTVIYSELKFLISKKLISKLKEYYFIPEKDWTILKRVKAENNFQISYIKIFRAGWILSHFPFVRAIFLTGSISKNVLEEYDDYDFLIITEPNHIWICKSIIDAFKRLISLNLRYSIYRFFDCNYFISKDNLTILDQNEFTALEIYFCKSIYNYPLYQEFLKENEWIKQKFKLPDNKEKILAIKRRLQFIQSFLEYLIKIFLKIFYRKNIIEKLIYALYYNISIKNQLVGNYEEFKSKGNFSQIKFFGNTQGFMVENFLNTNNNQFRNKVSTKVLRSHLFQTNENKTQGLDIVLTHAYYLSKTKKDKKVKKPYVPLGPLYIASYLKAHGFKVAFYDTTFKKGPSYFSKDIIIKFKNASFGIIGIYVTEMTRKNALKMIKACRRKSLVVIVGGPDPSNVPELYVENGANIVVIGEGEQTMLEILQEINNPTKSFTDIEGIYSEQGFSDPRTQLKKLDDLPFPAYELLDLKPYFRMWKKFRGHTEMSIITSRGCPYDCSWCSKPVFGNNLRLRSPKNVVNELVYLKNKFNPEFIHINDDIFGINEKWLKKFHFEILNNNHKMNYECLLRIDIVKPKILQLLKESGCNCIWFGIESGSQKILNRMSKHINITQLEPKMEMIRKANLKVGFFIMLGYPGENSADINLTRKLLKLTKPNFLGISMAYPITGTKFYKEITPFLKKSRFKLRLENSSRITFKTKYPPIYYGIVKRLLETEKKIYNKVGVVLVNRIIAKIYSFIYRIFALCLN